METQSHLASESDHTGSGVIRFLPLLPKGIVQQLGRTVVGSLHGSNRRRLDDRFDPTEGAGRSGARSW